MQNNNNFQMVVAHGQNNIVGNDYIKETGIALSLMQLCAFLFLVSCQNMLLYTQVDTTENKLA